MTRARVLPPPPGRREHGMVLLCALLLMLAAMIAGVAVARTSAASVAAARYERERLLARGVTEWALRDAERDIEGAAAAGNPARAALFAADAGPAWPAACGQGGAERGLCAEAAPPAWQRLALAAQDNPVLVPFGQLTGAPMALGGGLLPARRPAYLIEKLAGAGEQPAVLRITAVGFGTLPSTLVVLQALYRKAPTAAQPPAGPPNNPQAQPPAASPGARSSTGPNCTPTRSHEACAPRPPQHRGDRMHRMQRTPASRAFTLVELMIVMAIIAILATLAWPNYSHHLVRMKRVEGQVGLIEAMQQQERFQSQHNSYLAFSSSDTEGDAEAFRWWSGHDAATSAYELDAHACPDGTLADCVEISARPGTVKVDARFRDPDCGMLTLDSTGRQGAQAARDAAVRCWP